MIFFFQTTYNNLSVEIKVTHLLAVLHDGNLKEDARLMAAVLLRRLFSSDFQEFYAAVRHTRNPKKQSKTNLIVYSNFHLALSSRPSRKPS